MKRFEVGDVVRVIGGPRKGEVTTVVGRGALKASDLASTDELSRFRGFKAGHPLLRLDLMTRKPEVGFDLFVWAAPEWLEHFRDSRDRGEWDELTRNLCKPKRVRA